MKTYLICRVKNAPLRPTFEGSELWKMRASNSYKLLLKNQPIKTGQRSLPLGLPVYLGKKLAILRKYLVCH